MSGKFADLIIVGAGASGLAAAIAAAEHQDRVILLEAQEQPGKKILASGNGRCNIMNSGPLRYYGDTSLAFHVLQRINRDHLRSFLHRYGVLLSHEEDRLYPSTFQAKSVMSSFKNAVSHLHISMVCSERVGEIRKEQGLFRVHSVHHNTYSAPRIIIACGGLSQMKLSGSSDGYRFLEKFGHSVSTLRPALAPLITDKKSISGLRGIRVKCGLSLLNNGSLIHREAGELLFADDGISGICSMQMARFIEGPGFYAEVNFLQRIYSSLEEVKKEFSYRKKRFENLDPTWLLNGMTTEKISYAICKQAGIPLRGESISELSEEQTDRIAYTSMHYRIDIQATKGFDFAQVTSGGACQESFDPDTLESRLIPGLHAAGEVLNVDGDCGGFNLMFALSSGILAGLNNRELIMEG